jgi:nicotinate phosphoribosyltransferase
MSSTLSLDTYQLTTLVSHFDAGRLAADHRLSMAFFFRKLPRNRRFVLACGLRQALAHAAQMRFDAADLEALRTHPLLGPAFAARPGLWQQLERLDGFDGAIDALPEGTPAFAGPAVRTDGSPFAVLDTPVTVYTPLAQARTDLLRAKLIETPFLSAFNHACMVASKAARVVIAADGAPVLEFGQRRTHREAAVDATYAAWVAGCAGSSNLRAWQTHGIPAVGTMDHFAIQAAEAPGVPVTETEVAAFAAFFAAFPTASTLLVDTYDTLRGVKHGVVATGGQLQGVRLDSNVTPALVRDVRALLDGLGADAAKIFVSDGLDEHRVAELRAAGADGFGVGENITCSPDAPVGVGCVGKVVVNGYGKITMKLARGSGKATLPGHLQVYRFADHDVVATAEETSPGGTPLLEPAWRGRTPVGIGTEAPRIARERARTAIAALPAPLRALAIDAANPGQATWPLVVSDALAARIEDCVRTAWDTPAADSATEPTEKAVPA